MAYEPRVKAMASVGGGANFFFEWLPVGEYTFKHRIRANMAGTFKVSPATVESMYAPEFHAYSAGATLKFR